MLQLPDQSAPPIKLPWHQEICRRSQLFQSMEEVQRFHATKIP